VGKRGNGEGSIYRRKVGRWVGQFTAQAATGQKRQYVYGKTRAEVAAKLAKAIADRDVGLRFDAGKLTVLEYLTAWLNDSVRGSVRPGTYRRYEQLCRGHIIPALGRMKLAALSPAHIQQFYKAKLDADLSPRTVQYLHATLHRALGRAV
jgi:integrase